MAAPRKTTGTSKPRRPPATTPEARENQLISAAVDLAEKQLLDGSASSQVLTHYLKLATTRERLEQTKIQREIAVLDAKVESYESGKRIEEMYGKALNAMKSYSGQDVEEDDPYED